ncbi:hypothetical protein CNR22_22300 [Sphingobacteriaceae bacterium]|nr:hypothetical protein CNR22_22300 [Sphingobacteriaceae bacterium]
MKNIYKTLIRNSFLFILFFSFHTSFKAQIGEALNFDGTNDHVQMSSFSFGTSWTAEAWIRPTNLTGNWNTVLGQSYYNNMQGFVVAVQNGSVFVDGPQGGFITTGISNAVWTHIAVTFNNGIYAFYKNGLIVGTKAAPFSNSSNPFYLGIRTNNTNSGLLDPYQGDMDEVRIWSTARSQCEIQQFMNCEITTTATALVANYHFNQGLANSVLNILAAPFTLSDATGNGHSGAVTNFGLNLSGTSNWVAPGGVTSGYTTTASAPTAEIDVKGNATTIVDGDVTPSTGDFTDFNGVATRTFIIYNTGSQTLNVASPVITGPDASSFSVFPVSSNILATLSGTASFIVAFTPTSLGVKTASINIYNQDCNEQFYMFGITATCVAGAALSFDGLDDYVETGANLAQLGQADFTMEAWIKTTGVSEGIITYCDNDAGWEPGEMSLYLDASGIPNFVGFNNGYITGNIAVNNGAWHHLALVWDYSGSGNSGTGHMYVDGVDHTGSMGYSANSNNGAGSFKIGKQNYNNYTPEAPNNFVGEIDEVRVYDRALCLPEILHNMNCEILSPGSYPDLNGYYKFNQGIAFGTNSTFTIAADAAVFNNPGVLTNFTLTGGPSSNWSAPGAVASGVNCPAYLDAEINLKGNTVNIVNGNMTPSTSDHTNFGFIGLGSVLSRTFVIQNTGTASLTISSYNITGANATSFTITTNPTASVVASGSTAIVVSFSASTLGARNALLTINNNDCDESVYTFSISATGAAAAAALNFDGTGDAINTTDPVIGLSDFTIEGWIKPSAAGGFIVSSRFSEGFQTGYWYTIGTSSTGIIGMEMAECGNGGSNYATFNATHSITPGTWGHYAVVRSGSNYKLYINGNLSTTFTETASHNFDNSTVNPSNILNIGGWIQNNCCWYTGSMDELRIWKVARTQCEIQSFMNCEIPTTASNLVSNYHFNQGADALANPSINRLVDASASAYTGTLNAGFALTGSTSNWIAPGGVTSGNTASVTSLIEIDITGNGTSIPDGNAAASTTNFTDFNGAMTRTFVVQNTVAGGTLLIGTLSITGANANQFSVTTLPSSSISGIGSTSFVVSFIPTSAGAKNATVNIASNDCNESLYDFVITATGIPGAAMNFDGVNDNITVASGITLNNQSFTIEFLAKRTGTLNNMVAGLGSIVSNNNALHIGFRNAPGNQFTFAFYGNDINFTTTASTDQQYHHWACVYDATATGTNRFVYLDGILVASDQSPSAFLGTGPFIIGDAGYGGNLFDGSVDELRVWSTPRSQCEIQDHMNCEIPTTSTGLIANYHFNQGVAGGANATNTLLIDAAGTHTGTLSNFTLSGLSSNWTSPGGVISGSNCPAFTYPDIAVQGSTMNIANGSTVPNPADFTQFNNAFVGSSSTRTFVIFNAGTSSLSISSFSLSGINASDFSITTNPATSIAPSASTSIVITFSPATIGLKSATLNIISDDCDENPFSFAIQANGLMAAAALNFDGADDYVDLGSSNTLKPTTALTAETWAYKSSWTGTFSILGNPSGGGFSIRTATAGNTIGAYVYRNGAFGTVTYPLASLSVGWHHFALTYDGRYTHFYIDGILGGVNDAGANYPITYAGNNTLLGAEAGAGATPQSGYYFNGDLDEVRIWNTARTQCELQTYMNTEITSTFTGLVANYHFNEGLVNSNNAGYATLPDFSGSSNTGTLTSFALTSTVSNWVIPGAVQSGVSSPSIPASSITVSGNSNVITNGSTGTSTLNYTNFGTLSSGTFVIQNSGSGTLNISAPYFTGANASEFSVTTLPSLSLAASATTSFVVAFTPTTGGFRTATLNINSNDCNIPLFNCAIGGTPAAASALDFDGTDDYVACGNILTSSYTKEAWVKLNTVNIANNVMSGDATTPHSFWMPGGTLSAAHNSSLADVADTGTMLPGIWYHVAVSYDAPSTTMRLFKNGVMISQNTAVSPLTSGGMVYIGAYMAAYNINGVIDEARVWNYARTQCEIQSFMNCEIPTTASGLVANYHFNQGAAGLANPTQSLLIDAAGTNNGTLSTFNLTGATSNWVTPGGVISGSFTPAPPTASILITGNSNSITPGATTSSTLNFTDFGGSTTRTFFIQNSATGILNIGTPLLLGANVSQFSLASQPSQSLGTSASTSFEVVFTPTSTGVISATILIPNNDCAHGDFSFVITATAVTGAALSFDGIDDYVDLGNSNILKPTAALTAETWVYSATWPALDRTILGNTESAGYGIFTSATGDLQGLVRRNSSWGTVNTPLSGLSPGWHHVGLTYDGRYTRLYLDGLLKSTDDALNNYNIDYIANNTLLGGEASAGSSAVPTWFFNGKLDETRFWNRALCEAEIQNYLQCEITTTASGLLANYHFNEGVASGANSTITALPDVSGNALNGSFMAMSKVGSTSNFIAPGAIISGSSCSAFTSSEIDVVGNGVSIIDGAVTSTISNSTDFSTVCVSSTVIKTFTLQNTGTAVLSVTSLSLSGASASSFSFGVISPASPIATNSFAVFSLSFTPQSVGSHSAILTVNNNDCDEGAFDFVITGTANALPTVSASITNSVICAGSAVTLNGSGADTYTWTPTVSNGVSFIPAASQVYTLTGTYTLTGCTNTNIATQSLIVNAIPTVAISAPLTTICSGTNVTLTASGAGTGGTYTWTPASNATTLIVSPLSSTTYSLAGTSTAGCTSTNSISQLITVNTTPTISATSVNTAICNTFSTTISVNGATTYSWFPGSLSGGTITVSPSTNTTYTAVGYGATGCISSNSITLTVTVNSLPVVTATASNPVICNTGSTSLIGGGADTYTWNPTAVNGQIFTPPAGTTAYTVTGTNTLTGCTSANLAVQSVTVDVVPTVSISTTNSVICNGTTATLTASGAATYTWNPGNFVGSVFNPTPSILTTYSVVGTSSAGCTSTNLAVQSVSVNALPTVSASISNSVVCAGEAITVNGSGASTYSWNNGVVDGVAFTPASTGSYSVAGTNSAGCTSTNVALVSVTVNTLPALSVSVTNSVICLGGQSTLNGSGALTYTWSNGVVNGTAFSPTTTAQYTLTATDNNGCSAEALSTITVNNLPLLTVVSSASVSCEAQSVTLTVNGAASYTWSTSENGASVVITPTVTTAYSITAIDANACTNTVSYTQSVTPCPGTFTATIDKTDISCLGKDNGAIVVTAVSSYSNPVYSYHWNSSTLCSANNCDTLKNLPSGTYYLTVKITYTVNKTLIKQDSLVMAPIVLTDLNGPCDVKVFSGLSPNDDGVNDVMAIENIEEFPNNNVTVYNRWGVEVFKIKGYNNLDKAFPVRDEIKNLPSNTYFYIIDLGDGSKVIKGWIELIKN